MYPRQKRQLLAPFIINYSLGHTPIPCSYVICFNNILEFMHIYPNWPLHSSVSNHNSVHILQFHQSCYMFGPPNPRDHYDSVSWKGTSCDAPVASSPCYLTFHWSKLLPKYFVHVHPRCFLPQYERPVFTHLSFELTVYNHCHFCSML